MLPSLPMERTLNSLAHPTWPRILYSMNQYELHKKILLKTNRTKLMAWCFSKLEKGGGKLMKTVPCDPYYVYSNLSHSFMLLVAIRAVEFFSTCRECFPSMFSMARLKTTPFDCCPNLSKSCINCPGLHDLAAGQNPFCALRTPPFKILKKPNRRAVTIRKKVLESRFLTTATSPFCPVVLRKLSPASCFSFTTTTRDPFMIWAQGIAQVNPNQ